MRLSLTWKLFICFFGLTALVLLATLLLARWSFERGFLDYTNTLDQGRLERISLDLIGVYQKLDNDWSGLTEQDFELIVDRHAPGYTRRGPRPAAPPPDARDVPAGSVLGALEPKDEGPGAASSGVGFEPTGRPPPLTALFDAQGMQIAGDALTHDPDRLVSIPVVIDNVRVGKLRSLVVRKLDSPIETDFSRQQSRRSLYIGATALLLSALVSGVLSRRLLAPVKVSIGKVARLSNGDYDNGGPGYSGGDELGQLVSDLERLRKALAAARHSRRRLLADVSHELRTPLTIITGEIEGLKDGLRSFDARQLGSLDQEVTRLRSLVDDLYELSLSDVGGLRYEFESLDVRRCLAEVVKGVVVRAAERGISVQLTQGDPLYAKADRRRLEQLFTNLMNNAMSYTDSPGEVHIQMTPAGNEVQIIIEDSPPGVSSHDELFNALYRDEGSRNRRNGGVGLGLSICRNIVAAHQGSICASRSSLGGLRVEVRLPRQWQGSKA